MTPARLRAILEALHWTQRDLAAQLPCSERVVRRWSGDEAPIPPEVADWLEQRLQMHEHAPPPTGWKRRRAA